MSGVTPPPQRRSSSDDSPPSLNVNPIIDFEAHVRNTMSKYTGRDGYGNRVTYIPYFELARYWTLVRIGNFFRRTGYGKDCPCPPEKIHQDYIRIFSLLAYVDKVQYLRIFVENRFTDTFLTQDDVPWVLSTPTYDALRQAWQEYRWRFYPFCMDSNLLHGELPNNIILPFDSEVDVSETDSSIIKRIVTREFVNDEIVAKEYVIKTYKRNDQARFRNESNILMRVQDLNSQNIIKYYGWFRQTDKYNLVLQYVDGGNLWEFLENTPPPSTPDDAYRFWCSLCSVLKGLDGLHRLRGNDDADQSATGDIGVHEDLKLDNILIMRCRGSTSAYDFIPILTDFGHSQIRRVPTGESNVSVPDSHGNEEFAAPEASHHARYQQSGPATVTTKADMWSIGCILSVAAAWVVLGLKGVEQYEGLRKQEATGIINFEDARHHNCFHDAVRPLKAVADMHAIIDNEWRRQHQHHDKHDHNTARVGRLLLTCSIVGDPKDRKSARDLYELIRNTTSGIVAPDRNNNIRIDTHAGSTTNTPQITSRDVQLQCLAQQLTKKGHSTSHKRGHSPDSAGSRASNTTEPVGMHSLGYSREPFSPLCPYPSPASDLSSPLAKRPALANRQVDSSDSTNANINGNSDESISKSHRGIDDSGSQGIHSRPSLSPARTSLFSVAGIRSPSESRQGLGQHAPPVEGGSNSNSHSSPPQSPDASFSANFLSIEDCHKWVDADISRQRKDKRVDNLIRLLQRQLKGREYIFLVDDSLSMHKYRVPLKSIVRTFAHIAKPMDPNRTELIFASEPSKSHKSHNTPLIGPYKFNSLFDTCQFNQIDGFMEHSISKVVSNIIENMSRSGTYTPVSVFIFTDGCWGNTSETVRGVERPIQRLMDFTKKNTDDRTRSMIQFVRFGNDEHGIGLLDYLDRFGKKTDWDIVDHKPTTANVLTIFAGSINPNGDDEGEDEYGLSIPPMYSPISTT